MSKKTLAFPYSKAFFDLESEENRLESAYSDMKIISQIGNENPELTLALENPLIPLEKKRILLLQVMRSLNPKTLNLVELLIQKERASLIFSVADEFSRQYREFKKILSIEITTAQSLKPALEKKIQTHIEKVLSEKIEMKKNIDPDVIGGLMIQIGDKRYDGTIRKSLLDLKKKLLEKVYS